MINNEIPRKMDTINIIFGVQQQPSKSIIQAIQIRYQDRILNVGMHGIILRGITGIARTKKGLIDAGSKTAGFHH